MLLVALKKSLIFSHLLHDIYNMRRATKKVVCLNCQAKIQQNKVRKINIGGGSERICDAGRRMKKY